MMLYSIQIELHAIEIGVEETTGTNVIYKTTMTAMLSAPPIRSHLQQHEQLLSDA